MPLYSAEALVLRTYKLGESDRIVVFLTRDRGKKRGVAQGARVSRRRFGRPLEPFTRVRVAYFEKESRELVSLNFADPLASPMAARDPAALGYVGYFAELLDAWAQDNDAQEALFRLGSAVLDALSDGAPAVPLARYFEYWLLKLQGVYPSIGRCADCGRPFGSRGAALDRDRAAPAVPDRARTRRPARAVARRARVPARAVAGPAVGHCGRGAGAWRRRANWSACTGS